MDNLVKKMLPILFLTLSIVSCGTVERVQPSFNEDTESTPITLPASNPTSTMRPQNASLICNSYIESDLPNGYFNLSTLVNTVITNLNNCASPAAIMDDLRFIDKQGFVFTIDLNHDHVEEIIVGGVLFLLPPEGQTGTEHNSNLVVFYQQNARYEAKIMFEGMFNGYPEISNIMDVNGDGIREAIFTIPYGGSGCNEYVSVIGWHDNEPIDYFRDVHGFVDCPAVTDFVDLDHDGIMEVVQKHQGASRSDFMLAITFRLNMETNTYNAIP
jgi:hypothetical protein